MWKAGYAAMASRQAVFAAELARVGMTGPRDAFDGANGFWAQIGWRERPLRPLAGAGITPGVLLTNIKRWPVRDSCQLPIDVAVELRERLAGLPVRALRIETYASADQPRAREPELWAPQTRETADHSMPFLVCAALIDGAVTIETFERKRFLDHDVRELIARTTLAATAAFTAVAPAMRNCRIEARLEDGSGVVVQRERASRPQLDPARSQGAIDSKFIALAAGVLGDARARALQDALWTFEHAPSIASIVDLTGVLDR